jgi:pimeloyl-ACP methyl ester carboxylesterase
MPRPPEGALRAQARALPILLTTLALPGARALARLGGRPSACETRIAGAATTVVRPFGRPPRPTLVFLNGATPDGRRHPTVRRLAFALARGGIAVVVPDLAGVAAGELSLKTLAQSVAVAEEAAASTEAGRGRVALAGVSVGATLALLTAADDRLRDRISVVACVAPFGDLAEVMRLATTGTYRDGGRLHPHPPPDFLRTGLARSLAAMLEGTPATAASAAEAAFDILANTDPARFDELYGALPSELHRAVAALSPVDLAHRISAPVELVTAPDDAYFPLSQARALERAAPHARLTVTSLLAHSTPRPTLRGIADLGRLDAFFVRTLAAVWARPVRRVS